MMKRTMWRRSVIGRQPPDHGPLRIPSLWIKCGQLHPLHTLGATSALKYAETDPSKSLRAHISATACRLLLPSRVSPAARCFDARNMCVSLIACAVLPGVH